ncbi:MAG: DUF58 domain-containing protein [Lachnospiraceae bacterium]|nr:DUF58 domain-containing protein [Lachnospiraceae bacterium]
MPIFIMLLGAGAVFFVVRAVYRKYWNSGLSIDIRFDSEAGFEQDRGTLTETIENRSFLPLPFLHAKFEVGAGIGFSSKENVSTSDKNYKNDLFSILFFQRIVRTLPFVCLKRGYYPITAASLISEDLFFTSHMVAEYPVNTHFYVYPGQVDLRSLEDPLRKLMGDVKARSYLYPDPFEFRGIREYTVNDPFNTINWKASARSQSLMVNEYGSTVSKEIDILLNLEDEKLISEPQLQEEALRLAGTLIVRLLSQGYPVRLITNGRDAETKEAATSLKANGPADRERLLRALSRLDLSLEPQEFYPVLQQIGNDPDRIRIGCILISSCMKEPLQEAFRKLSEDTAAFWVAPLYKLSDMHLAGIPAENSLFWEVK